MLENLHHVEKRASAREAGLCCVCCKGPSCICESCHAAKGTRRRRKRQRNREAAKSRPIIEGHELAGDVAREYHVYELAARHYQDALQLTGSDDLTWIRLSEKHAEALQLSDKPGAVNEVNDRLLATLRTRPHDPMETRCKARNRQGGACGNSPLPNGRCRFHGGLSTAPEPPKSASAYGQPKRFTGHTVLKHARFGVCSNG